MAQSLRRQKILFKRKLQRLVEDDKYVLDDTGNYRTKKPVEMPDLKYPKLSETKADKPLFERDKYRMIGGNLYPRLW